MSKAWTRLPDEEPPEDDTNSGVEMHDMSGASDTAALANGDDGYAYDQSATQLQLIWTGMCTMLLVSAWLSVVWALSATVLAKQQLDRFYPGLPANIATLADALIPALALYATDTQRAAGAVVKKSWCCCSRSAIAVAAMVYCTLSVQILLSLAIAFDGLNWLVTAEPDGRTVPESGLLHALLRSATILLTASSIFKVISALLAAWYLCKRVCARRSAAEAALHEQHSVRAPELRVLKLGAFMNSAVAGALLLLSSWSFAKVLIFTQVRYAQQTYCSVHA